nr:hypothetical protein [Tellurirhabdus rosea]
MEPTEEVGGVGAVVEAVPPVAVVYQRSVAPPVAVAVRGEADAFWQYVTVGLTAGAAGGAITTT